MSAANKLINLAQQLTSEQYEGMTRGFFDRRGVDALTAITVKPNRTNKEYQCIEKILTDYGLPTENLDPEALRNFALFSVDSNLS